MKPFIWASSPAERAFQVSLAAVKFSSPELSSLAISQREWREVAGSYGRYRQERLNINNEFEGWWIHFLWLSGEKLRGSTSARAAEVQKMPNMFFNNEDDVSKSEADTCQNCRGKKLQLISVLCHHLLFLLFSRRVATSSLMQHFCFSTFNSYF